jgi:phosphate ABC transporter permease protein PstC
MEAGSLSPTSPLRTSLAARLPDRLLRWALFALSAGILALLVYFFFTLWDESRPLLSQTGIFDFVFSNDWNPAKNLYGAWALVVGTLITSAIALVLGVPVAVAIAIYIVELAPQRVKYPLTVLVELLAAVPSVVYGLWGVFVLIPNLKPAEQWFSDTFAFLPFVGGPVSGPNYFIAGLILAIMILPIVSAISREVISTVPIELKEGALALGATRWEMIRMGVLPYSWGGIAGASMLGLGRALGETIAVVLVIGNAPQIGETIFSQGYTLAAVIANEFGEAANDPEHKAALIACGLVLFILTLVVNFFARWIVTRSERRRHSGAITGAADAEEQRAAFGVPEPQPEA